MTSLNYTFNSNGNNINNINNIYNNGITMTGMNDNSNNINNNSTHPNNGAIFSSRTLLHPMLDSTTPRASVSRHNISFATITAPPTTNLNNNYTSGNSCNNPNIIHSNYYRSASKFNPNNPSTNTNNGGNASSHQKPQSQHYSYFSNFVPKLNPSNTQYLQADDINTNNNNNNNYTPQNTNGLFVRPSVSYDFKNPFIQNSQYYYQNSEYDNNYTSINCSTTTPVSVNSNNTKDTKFLSLLSNPVLRNNSNNENNNNNNSLIDYNSYLPENSPVIQHSQNHPRLSISSQQFNSSTIFSNGPAPPLMTPNIKTESLSQYRTGHSLSFSGPTTVSASNLSALSAHSPGVASSMASTQLCQQKRQNNQKLFSQQLPLRSLSISSNPPTVLNGGTVVPTVVNPRYSISSSYNPSTLATTTIFTGTTISPTAAAVGDTISVPATTTMNTDSNSEYSAANLNPIINGNLSPKSTYRTFNSNTLTQDNGITHKRNYGNNNDAIFTVEKSREEEVYPHKCEQCMKSFKRHSWLKRHLLSHSAERHFFCQWCLSRHKRKDNLLQHMKLKHPKYLYQELRLANVPFKWQRSKNINFMNIPDEKRIDYIDSIKSLLHQGILSKEDVKRVLNEIIERNH